MKRRKFRIYSFDVFDTCMARTCGKPENIFRLLAEEVVRDRDESLLRAFVMERKSAEKKAMLSLQKEAVTLDEIYDVLDLSPFTDMPKEQIKRLEISLEQRSFSPIQDTVKKINSLRGKGRILFISDMYLPDEVIREGLMRYGIMQENDALYISGSVGLSKHTGRLFEYVREKECIRKRAWTHYGDNIHGDYFIPKKKGIRAKLIHTGYSEYEAVVENGARFFVSPLAASVFAGLMRAARLGGRSDDGGFVADIMAPLLVPFVDAILKDAVMRRIRRLYFASRDAYVMFLVAKELLPLYKDLEIRYLHISTKSVYPASVQRADKSELSRLLKYIGCFSPRKIMQMLDCTDEEMRDMERSFDLNKELRYSNTHDVNAFMEKLLEGEKRNKIQIRCAVKRELLMDYLRQEEFCSDGRKPVGLVDVGWRCTTQGILREIIDAPVTYYYWGVSRVRVNIGQSGPFMSYYYAEDFSMDMYRNKSFIEFYICRNAEGSTLGYKRTDTSVVPVLGRRETSSMDEEIRQNHKSVLCFARQYQQYACLREYSSSISRLLFPQIMYRFIRYPDKSMVAFLSKKLWWNHFLGKKIPVIIKLYPWTVLYIVVFYLLKNKYDNVYKYRQVWLEASLVYTYGRTFGKWLIQCKNRLLASEYISYLVWRLLRDVKSSTKNKYDI